MTDVLRLSVIGLFVKGSVVLLEVPRFFQLLSDKEDSRFYLKTGQDQNYGDITSLSSSLNNV